MSWFQKKEGNTASPAAPKAETGKPGGLLGGLMQSRKKQPDTPEAAAPVEASETPARPSLPENPYRTSLSLEDMPGYAPEDEAVAQEVMDSIDWQTPLPASPDELLIAEAPAESALPLAETVPGPEPVAGALPDTLVWQPESAPVAPFQMTAERLDEPAGQLPDALDETFLDAPTGASAPGIDQVFQDAEARFGLDASDPCVPGQKLETDLQSLLDDKVLAFVSTARPETGTAFSVDAPDAPGVDGGARDHQEVIEMLYANPPVGGLYEASAPEPGLEPLPGYASLAYQTAPADPVSAAEPDPYYDPPEPEAGISQPVPVAAAPAMDDALLTAWFIDPDQPDVQAQLAQSETPWEMTALPAAAPESALAPATTSSETSLSDDGFTAGLESVPDFEMPSLALSSLEAPTLALPEAELEADMLFTPALPDTATMLAPALSEADFEPPPLDSVLDMAPPVLMDMPPAPLMETDGAPVGLDLPPVAEAAFEPAGGFDAPSANLPADAFLDDETLWMPESTGDGWGQTPMAEAALPESALLETEAVPGETTLAQADVLAALDADDFDMAGDAVADGYDSLSESDYVFSLDEGGAPEGPEAISCPETPDLTEVSGVLDPAPFAPLAATAEPMATAGFAAGDTLAAEDDGASPALASTAMLQAALLAAEAVRDSSPSPPDNPFAVTMLDDVPGYCEDWLADDADDADTDDWLAALGAEPVETPMAVDAAQAPVMGAEPVEAVMLPALETAETPERPADQPVSQWQAYQSAGRQTYESILTDFSKDIILEKSHFVRSSINDLVDRYFARPH